MKTAKIGALFLVAVMALTAIGAAYAHWEETLKIEGIMTTDNIDVYFDEDCTFTNDPYDGDWEEIADTDICGKWVLGANGYEWEGARRNKNVGWCNVSVDPTDDNILNIEIQHAYPCYYCHPLFCIKNRGSVPVQVYSVQLLEVSEGRHKITIDPVDLVPCTIYYVEIYKDPDPAISWTARVVPAGSGVEPDNFDFSIHLTGDQWAQGTQLDPDYWTIGDDPQHLPCGVPIVGAIYGDLNIHFENSCKQLTDYDFQIAVTFYNWPELPEPPNGD